MKYLPSFYNILWLSEHSPKFYNILEFSEIFAKILQDFIIKWNIGQNIIDKIAFNFSYILGRFAHLLYI